MRPLCRSGHLIVFLRSKSGVVGQKILVIASRCRTFCSVFPLHAASRDPITSTLDGMGAEATRMADYDLCFPANAKEYEAIGKNGVVRIEAQSAISSELPLKSVYLEVGGIRVPLRSIYLGEKFEDKVPATAKGTRYWHQISFYLIPLNLIKGKAELVIDFKGPRSGFGLGPLVIDGNAPAFVRLDECDTPSEPETSALSELLFREYPSYFSDT